VLILTVGTWIYAWMDPKIWFYEFLNVLCVYCVQSGTSYGRIATCRVRSTVVTLERTWKQ
jgi:hypothetical protein